MGKSYSDYRDILREKLEQRSRRNSRYSLRSFARDIGLSSARLSNVLSGRSGLSRGAAVLVARKLELSGELTEHFCDLVESRHARSKVQRTLAKHRLQGQRPDAEYRQLQEDVFRVVSDWYCFAIIELTVLKKFRGEPEWIAAALGITAAEAGRALESLQRLGLLGLRHGRWAVTGTFTTSVDVPSESVRRFYRQLLRNAQTALEDQGVDEREFSSLTLAFDSRRLPEAKAMLERQRREFDREFGLEGAKDRVYCLSTQFFNLTPALKEKRE